MVDGVPFVRLTQVAEVILENLFSDTTENYFNNMEFPSMRMAFLQGMNYAGLLCMGRLDQYLVIKANEPLKKEE